MSTSIALPARYTFTAWEGGTFRKRLTLLQGDSNSSPRDLSGYNALMNIRSGPDQTVLYSLSTSTGGITLGGATGTIDLFISDTDTLTFGSWASEAAVYDLAITDTIGTGDVEPLLYGVFRVRGLA